MSKDETGFQPKTSKSLSSPVRNRVIEIRKANPEMTYSVIGWNAGVTRQRVEQILNSEGLGYRGVKPNKDFWWVT